MARAALLLPALLLLVATSFAADGPATAPDVAIDEKVLTDAKQGTDGPALLQFFRKRTLSEADLARLDKMVQQLGAASYDDREKATQALIEAGRPAVPYLRKAVDHPDLEIAHRVERCLTEIGSGKDGPVVLAAARLLALRKPQGAAAAILGYLPFAEEMAEEELLTSLSSVGTPNGTPDAVLMAALNDRLPERRGAAALILGSSGDLKAVQPLLKDDAPKVRFRAAQGLLTGKHKEGVPTLLALLGEGPLAEAWQAEEVLFRLAGDKAPTVSVGSGEAADRRRSRDAWTTWWRDNADKVDLAKLSMADRPAGLTLIVAYDGYNQGKGRVFEISADGRTRWQIDSVIGPVDAQVLPGNRVLIAEYNASKFTERSLDGKILWERNANGSPVNCRRLANGNTFLATTSEIREITPDGKDVYVITGRQVYSAYKLRNGNIAYLSVDGSLIEVDAKGKEVRKFNAGAAPIGLLKFAVLPAGRFLVPQQTAGKVKEFDASGKVVWEGSIPNSRVVTRLHNGNTLVCGHNGDHRVAEVDRSGRVVWEKRLEGHAHFASRR